MPHFAPQHRSPCTRLCLENILQEVVIVPEVVLLEALERDKLGRVPTAITPRVCLMSLTAPQTTCFCTAIWAFINSRRIVTDLACPYRIKTCLGHCTPITCILWSFSFFSHSPLDKRSFARVQSLANESYSGDNRPGLFLG